MMTLTHQLVGREDPDPQREELSAEAIAAVLMDFVGYFAGVTSDRHEHPTDDLASLIANGRLGEEPLGDLETIGYYVIVATAGTTPRRAPWRAVSGRWSIIRSNCACSKSVRS